MTTTHTFASLLNEHLGGARPLRKRYWQRYKERAWRLFGVRIRNNPALREAVLARSEKRRRNSKVRTSMIVEEFIRRDFILSKLDKDRDWCGTMIVPFRAIDAKPIAFGAMAPPKEKFTTRLRRRLGLSR